MRVLVLGGYGLIGLEIVRALRGAGHDVIGLGRSVQKGRSAAPDVRWISADIATLIKPQSWAPHIDGVDAIVNASGALQDGARDNLRAAQKDSIVALIGACEGKPVRFVQISAPGAEPDANTEFMRTKAAADSALRMSALDWTILKPGLVLSANAYGGTSLLRMLTAVPFVQPLMLGDARVQIVAASDVADAVVLALEGKTPARRDYDLAATQTHALRDVVSKFRAWLGFKPPTMRLDLPRPLGFALARGADLAGWLGWRSPLRTTALRVLRDGIICDGAAWEAASGRKLKSLDQTLAALPATAQERLYARAHLVLPMLVLTLSAFWIASGAIGFFQRDAAARVLDGVLAPEQAMLFVLSGAVADLAIGMGLLLRPFTRIAALGAIAVSIAYLIGATLLAPHLWADPLGPLVKIFPGMALALAVAALTSER
ncbi:SDR family oxidoreductase [Vitreimonas flagellata]|uniref:SDR family oxidoreductase n=1 Tax=Vitreimonas flagellata TaxID=2560861 RepID=UPI00107570D7|nr:SDR family oxidoreductase [Vitreimonas flagellata]